MIFKNKRGDLSVTLLVIGTFLLCAFAIVVFLFSDVKVNNSFVGVEIMNQLNAEVDAYRFYSNEGMKIPSYLNIINSKGEEFFYLEKTKKKITLEGRKTQFLFSVKYPIPS